ncbi:unnamed protein product [Brachionus calyciflorus]|uniref:Uncharacterized protein n=1 Tax=Brachionus calyciflorus TaxID=104777 RepID=A0A814CVC9_9BILA|nr:unnamed protein product [Brachionus calyciflorus]
MNFCLIEWPLNKPGLLVSILDVDKIKMLNSKWDRFVDRDLRVGQFYFVCENELCFNVKLIARGKKIEQNFASLVNYYFSLKGTYKECLNAFQQYWDNKRRQKLIIRL